MKLIVRSMGRYKGAVALCMSVKLLATLSELMLPYILEHIIDGVAPRGSLPQAVFWGLLMFAAALACRQLNNGWSWFQMDVPSQRTAGGCATPTT